MLWTVIFIALAAIAFYAAYKVLHWAFPTYGTVLANIVAAVGFAVDFAAALPWGSVLDSKEAALIAFTGATLGNILARLNGPKYAVGSA